MDTISEYWPQIWGVTIIIVGIYYILKQDIPAGWEGQPAAFHIRGKYAVIVGVIAILIGLTAALEIPKFLRVDACLDSGDKYDYEKDACVSARAVPANVDSKRIAAEPERLQLK